VLTRIDHIGVACRDLGAAIAFYQSTFGLTLVSEETNPEQGVKEAMLAVAPPPAGPPVAGPRLAGPAGMSYVQLLEPLGPDTPVGRFLERRGEGIHHVGYGVTDIEAALAAISATGVRLLDARPRHGSMGASIAFLHPRDVGGVLTELVESARGR
jgi:methylmalonyl-CoA/ethylmalonyl-CoA epimerase